MGSGPIVKLVLLLFLFQASSVAKHFVALSTNEVGVYAKSIFGMHVQFARKFCDSSVYTQCD